MSRHSADVIWCACRRHYVTSLELAARGGGPYVCDDCIAESGDSLRLDIAPAGRIKFTAP